MSIEADLWTRTSWALGLAGAAFALAVVVGVAAYVHVGAVESRLERLEQQHRADHDLLVQTEAEVERLSAVLERQVSAAELAEAIVREAERRQEQ